MDAVAIRFTLFAALACVATCLAADTVRAQTSHQIIFHVLHTEDTSVYIDVGRNSGLDEGEGATLLLFHAETAANSGGVVPPGAKPIAELKVLIVADSSAVCEILNARGDVRIGDLGFITVEGRRPESEGLIRAKDHPISMAFSDGDPRDDEVQRAISPQPASPGLGHSGGRIGLDYDGTQVKGGFRANEIGFQISSDMTKIAGTNWNFTGFWRGRLRQTDSGLNGSQLESLDNRIDRTYHIGLYYDSPQSAMIGGFGRLSVPGAPSLPTIDGGYVGRKINPHVTLGGFGGSTPDPTAWDYNPNQRIGGIFTNLEAGDFGGLHFSGTEGIAMTAIHWRMARQFAFLENSISWKRYLWFYNSTQVDAARTSPVPGAGSNNTGISYTSSSLRIQPLRQLSVGIDHSYSNSLPTFDPNLLGTSLLDKYIFQGLSFDVRYELPYRIGLFTQLGRGKSNADAKQMWNQMYGISFGNILHSGFSADVRYSKFNSSFGRGNYQAISISRNLRNGLQVNFLAGSQSLTSAATTNTSSRFVTESVTWSLGPRYFAGFGYTWSQGISMNYQQWDMMFGYRFGTFRGQ